MIHAYVLTELKRKYEKSLDGQFVTRISDLSMHVVIQVLQSGTFMKIEERKILELLVLTLSDFFSLSQCFICESQIVMVR